MREHLIKGFERFKRFAGLVPQNGLFCLQLPELTLISADGCCYVRFNKTLCDGFNLALNACDFSAKVPVPVFVIGNALIPEPCEHILSHIEEAGAGTKASGDF
ncbi:MAG: hypothetical protein AAGC95_02745 [Pseudomonadota bacterium]